jgi:dUTP pyrophosphatase
MFKNFLRKQIKSVLSEPVDIDITVCDYAKPYITYPKYQHLGDAGMDVRAMLTNVGAAETDKDGQKFVVLKKGTNMLIPTGLKISSMPIGIECQVRARSGNALKYQVHLSNGIGTVDSCYKDEVGIIIENSGKKDFIIRDGDRLAQLVFARYVRANLKFVSNVDTTNNRGGGFGHSGKN